MAENDPLLVASASSALSRWKKPRSDENDEFPEVPSAFWAAREGISRLVDDSDELTSAIAQASESELARRYDDLAILRWPEKDDPGEFSLIIHGTHAYTNRWWFPSGDFHKFVKASVRTNLYAKGDAYAWSGRLKARDRNMGAERLAFWLDGKGTHSVDTVFAHSYGGSVALAATTHGVSMRTLVLLSVPVDNFEIEWRNIGRAVSLRIHCDLILLATTKKQRFTANVEEHWLDSWFVRHDMSHDEKVWADEEWARQLALIL
jgi:hypothetical protein